MSRELKTLYRVRRDVIKLRDLIERTDIEPLKYNDVLLETFIQSVDELIKEGNKCNN